MGYIDDKKYTFELCQCCYILFNTLNQQNNSTTMTMTMANEDTY